MTSALLCGVGSIMGEQVGGYGLSFSQGLEQLPLYAALVWWPVFVHLKDVLAASPAAFVAIMLATAAIAVTVASHVWRRGTLLARWGLVWAALGFLAPSFFSPVLFDRYLSFPLVGVGLLVSGLVEGLRGRWLRLALVVVSLWAALSLPQIWLKIDHWRQAGTIVLTVRDEIMQRYPTPATNASFFFIGLPDTRNGCHVWSCCIASAVREWYADPTLRARRDVSHGVYSSPGPGDIVLDFSARGWDQNR